MIGLRAWTESGAVKRKRRNGPKDAGIPNMP